MVLVIISLKSAKPSASTIVGSHGQGVGAMTEVKVSDRPMTMQGAVHVLWNMGIHMYTYDIWSMYTDGIWFLTWYIYIYMIYDIWYMIYDIRYMIYYIWYKV